MTSSYRYQMLLYFQTLSILLYILQSLMRLPKNTVPSRVKRIQPAHSRTSPAWFPRQNGICNFLMSEESAEAALIVAGLI
jgi:hypothetical protein